MAVTGGGSLTGGWPSRSVKTVRGHVGAPSSTSSKRVEHCITVGSCNAGRAIDIDRRCASRDRGAIGRSFERACESLSRSRGTAAAPQTAAASTSAPGSSRRGRKLGPLSGSERRIRSHQCYIYHLLYGATSGGANGRRGRAPHNDGTSQASLQGSRAPLLPLSRVAHPADHLQRMERVFLIHRRPKVRFATEVRKLYFGEPLLVLG